MGSITIRKPDDWHTHLRDGAMLRAVAPFTAARFGRAIVMPNLAPKSVVTVADAREYRKRILEATKEFPTFTPLMTLYLTNNTSPDEMARGFEEGIITAVKLYPAGATTNSDQGVTDLSKVYSVLAKMEEIGMPILLHGEVPMKNGMPVDAPMRENVFLEERLPALLKDFPKLKIVLEHATTKAAIEFVRKTASPRLAATITLHHLAANADDVAHDDHPAHLKCMPIIKSPADQKALREVATSGESYFFLGTDSAPHPVSAKERPDPASGVFTAPAALELYTQVFEEEGKLENLEAFASVNGPRFYGLPVNDETVTLKKEPWTINELVNVEGGDTIRPFGYHEDKAKRRKINWRLA